MAAHIDLKTKNWSASSNGNGAAVCSHWKGEVGGSKRNRTAWQVCCGDARAVLRKLPENQFGCVVTSPPYFWQRNYGVEGQIGLERSVSGYVNALADTMDEVYRVLDPSGVLFLNLGDTYYSGKGRPKGSDPKHSGRRLDILRAVDASGLGVRQKTALGMPWRVALELVARGWILRAPIIWRRERAMPEANVLDRPWRTYEFVFMFAKSRHYRFSRDALESEGVEDVWTIESQSRADRNHPAVFPSDLVRRCLDLADLKRGWVLDPFTGSGTVLKVAIEHGLNAFGIDLSQAFCQGVVKDLNAQARLISEAHRNASPSKASSIVVRSPRRSARAKPK